MKLFDWLGKKNLPLIQTNPMFKEEPYRMENGRKIHYQEDTDKWQIEMRRGLAQYAPHRGFSQCKGCNLPWWVVKHHTVMYSDHAGAFALCEMCWEQLPRRAVFEYYLGLIQSHGCTSEEIALLRKNILGDA